MNNKVSRLIRDEGGAITVMTVIMIFAFLGILAVVIDLGHLHTVQNELRNAADACALRGARAFYADVEPYVEPADKDRAKTEAQATVKMNYSDNALLQEIRESDIKVGVWDFANRTWLHGSEDAPEFTWPPDAADYGKVIGPGISLWTKKTSEGGTLNFGPVTTTLGQIFNVSSVNVNTPATAALSPLGEVTEDNWDELGKPPPLQVGDNFARNPGTNINLAPDNTDAGGWQSYYDLKNPSTPLLQYLIWGRVNPPDLVAGSASSGGTPIERSNGVNADLFSDNPSKMDKSLYWKWMEMTGRTAAGLGPDDTAPQQWTVTLPVTSSDGPFVGTAEILGFTRVTINRVYPSEYPDDGKKKTIDVTVLTTTWAGTGKGGGKYYGLMSVTPVLVR